MVRACVLAVLTAAAIMYAGIYMYACTFSAYPLRALDIFNLCLRGCIDQHISTCSSIEYIACSVKSI